MARQRKYFFNPETLAFENIHGTRKAKINKRIRYIGIILFISFLTNAAFFSFLKTPKQLVLERDRELLLQKYEVLDREIGEMEAALTEIQEMDDKIYRPIVGIDPLDDVIRQAGYGGSYPYDELNKLASGSYLVNARKHVDNLARQIYVQSKSYDEIINEIYEKERFLNCRPAIPPVSPGDYHRVSDYFGWRRDPFTRRPGMHYGLDLTAPRGTNIYATGDGIVTRASNSHFGYGLYVEVDHGYGYKTRYCHLSEIKVERGQRIKRGEVVGLMGNTGRSTGTHLHYEVRVNNKPVNPVYYFDFDITAEEYDFMLDIYASRE